jgi:hypothetical protein
VAADVGRHGTAMTVYETMLTAIEIERFRSLPSNATQQKFALQSLDDFVRHIFPEKKL